jgi:hypothetical protein
VESDAWLIESDVRKEPGTVVVLTIARNTTRTLKEIFDRYADLESDDYDFSRTHVPLNLATYGKETLVSRSQAKRVLARFENFKEVFLDFSGLDSIGQAFADEIFRVFHAVNPGIKIVSINANEDVNRMILRAVSAREQS